MAKSKSYDLKSTDEQKGIAPPRGEDKSAKADKPEEKPAPPVAKKTRKPRAKANAK